MAVDNNRKSGNTRIDVEFENELNKIAALDDSIEPEVLRGVNYDQIKDAAETSAKTLSPPAKKRWQQSKKSSSEMLRHTLLEIDQRRTNREEEKKERELAKAEREALKEANKQKRHEEKMQLMQLIFKNNLDK